MSVGALAGISIDTDAQQGLSRARQLWALTVLCATVGMICATLTSLYTAAPDLARALGASQTDLTWIVDAYTVALTGLLLPAGALGDRYGRRETMIAGLILWVLAAIPLQLVTTPTGLIVDRIVLGIAAALILPPTLSLITSTFPADFRDTAVGIWTASFTLGGGFGVVITALLLEIFSWRSSFWAVLIAGIIALLASLTLPTSRDKHPPPIDPVGSLCAAVAISALVFGLIDAGQKGWSSPVIIGTVTIGVVMCGVFAATQLARREPLLDVRLFAVRAFGVSAMTVTAAFAAVYGMFFMAIQFAQFVHGASSLKAALPIASMMFTVIPISLLATRLTRLLGLRVVISVGCLLCAVAFVAFQRFTIRTPYGWEYLVFGFMGAGTGLNMAPCTAAIINNVSAEKQGVAAAVNHTTRELGTALGVALLGGTLTAGYRSHILAAIRHLPPALQDASRQSIAEALSIAPRLHSHHAGIQLAHAARLAFVSGVQQTSLVMAGVMVGAALLALVWAPGHHRARVRTADQRSRFTHTAEAPASPGPLNGHSRRTTLEPPLNHVSIQPESPERPAITLKPRHLAAALVFGVLLARLISRHSHRRVDSRG